MYFPLKFACVLQGARAQIASVFGSDAPPFHGVMCSLGVQPWSMVVSWVPRLPAHLDPPPPVEIMCPLMVPVDDVSSYDCG